MRASVLEGSVRGWHFLSVNLVSSNVYHNGQVNAWMSDRRNYLPTRTIGESGLAVEQSLRVRSTGTRAGFAVQAGRVVSEGAPWSRRGMP